MQITEGQRPAGRARRRWFVALLRVGLGVAALWALRRELHDVRADVLFAQLRSYGWSHVTLAVISTSGSFLMLGVVELLAIRHTDHEAKRRIPVSAALGTGFVANAMSQSVGIALLTGTVVRARAYARYGLDAAALAQVTAFVTLTATIGLLAVGAIALLATSAPVVIGTTAIAVRPLGVLLGCIVLAYLAWSVVGKRDSVGRGRWRLVRPSPGMATGQVVLSVADWLLAGMVLYAFMPATAGLGIAVVLSAYAIAQTLAVASHIPAGAGVFEVAVLTLLTTVRPSVDRAPLVAALVMFRVMYYLVPLVLAIVAAAAAEFARARNKHEHVDDVAHAELWTQRAS
ncbi:MAG: lysylphosphatidylglycerol synthase domain-containing protein [bacterium]